MQKELNQFIPKEIPDKCIEMKNLIGISKVYALNNVEQLKHFGIFGNIIITYVDNTYLALQCYPDIELIFKLLS